jgi:hypothetical protein
MMHTKTLHQDHHDSLCPADLIVDRDGRNGTARFVVVIIVRDGSTSMARRWLDLDGGTSTALGHNNKPDMKRGGGGQRN